jgi:ABC-type transport system involved in multi-copper enzyme maturation permease subunit
MKYLAILKDSLREALDSTVLYVMIGLSTLVILFVATLSFKPLAAEKTMAKLVDGTISVMLDAQKPEKMTPERMEKLAGQIGVYKLSKVEVVKGEADSPDSEYRLTLSVGFPSADKAEEARLDPREAVAKVKEHFASAVEVGLIRADEVRLAPRQPDASHVFFEVTTRPTMETRRIWFAEPSLFFGAVPLSDLALPLGLQLYYLTSVVVVIGSWVAILAGIIIASFFIPNMLRKGTLDQLLVKPIRRWTLLLYKYIGGLTFIFINNAFAITGIWLVLGLRSGIWANSFLMLIFILTFYFAILYAVSMFVAVVTRNSVAAILVTVGTWFVFFLVGTTHQLFENHQRIEEVSNLPAEQRTWTNNIFGKVVRAVHAVLPRTSDLGQLENILILSDFVTGSWSEARKLDSSNIDWGESLLVSGLFIAVFLGLSCWWFSTKDY